MSLRNSEEPYPMATRTPTRTKMATKTNKQKQPLTTAQQLGSLIKSARDIMRKDKGLNGDIDRLPMLTWVMFLKFLDDLEAIHEQKAALAGKPYKALIQSPYRWRDWAAKEDGITGDDLKRFINDQEAVRPNGTKGKGLFEYLRQLRGTNGGRDQRDVIANIFRGVVNRMESGFLLREIVNRVNGIHFGSTEEIHTLGHLYESMLKEMRDAAGDSGEFYTPRPLVRFMVEVTNPRLGETVLDPACGTGGFLSTAFEHLSQQCRTVQDHETLQQHSLFGGEVKPLPYLLAQMNLLLHGLEYPSIAYANSLAVKVTEIGARERVDVILTNPPFGGEEEAGILGNFLKDKQTGETALLFLQLIMRKLRRMPQAGRAAVVVPNGTLFGDGVSARIKEELLKEFNLHTIVRLPNGVFAPYTSIATNLLFFDRSGPTEHVWYYDQPLPEGRKSYSKTAPLQFEEFSPLIAWWTKASSVNNIGILDAVRKNGVVPIAVERVALEVDPGEFRVADLNALGIVGRVQLTAYAQALGGGRGADQADDGLVADQRSAPPVEGDEAEQAMLDLVPLAGPRRQVANGQAQPAVVGEALQSRLPQPRARTVRATAVGADQQARGGRIARLAHLLPPAPHRGDGEFGRVGAHADTDPALVGGHVVDPKRRGAAQFLVHEIVDLDLLGLALGPILAAGVLELADQFLLLGIDRDDRLAIR